MTARDYFAMKRSLIPRYFGGLPLPGGRYDILVIEGRGVRRRSTSKKKDDIVNMGMAALADCPVLLLRGH